MELAARGLFAQKRQINFLFAVLQNDKHGSTILLSQGLDPLKSVYHESKAAARPSVSLPL